MNGASKTKQQLLQHIAELKNRLLESEDTLEAIRTGAVDALIVSNEQGERIFTLESVDYSYRVMVENMNEGAVTLDKNGVLTFSNKAFAAMVGCEMAEIVGASFYDFLHVSVHQGFTTFLTECAVKPQRKEFFLLCFLCGTTPAMLSGTVFEFNGRQNICLIVRDLTESKDAERILRNAYAEVEKKVLERTAELSRVKERLSLAQRAGGVGTFEWDFSTDKVLWTPELEEVYGLARGGFAGTKEAWEKLIHPDDRPEVFRQGEEAKQKGDFKAEWRVVRPDGTIRWLAGKAWVSKDETGNPQRLIGVSIDITERKNMEVELRRNAEQLAAANKELESFSYSISHDLRAPLRAMDGFSSILLEDYADALDAQGQDFLRRIKSSTEKMRELIEDMLNLSKISRQTMKPQLIDLSIIADSIVNELRQQEPQRKVDVVIAPGLTAYGDARLMTIALLNLIGNAWKYSGKTADASIEFGAVEKYGQKTYFVRDNGAGFDMAYVKKLFVPFQRLHLESQFPGTGIGLAIVKKIIERHRGCIWGDSVIDKGATFCFTLPINNENMSRISVHEGA
ncbi:MAG: PAS domain-containing protein [Chitinivibrionales bacterium]|nr:PAS domain-containing protein [Chitinivibrionales bacterium]